MKISELFSRIQKSSTSVEGSKASPLVKPVQPVGIAGRLALVPGQLLQGEVVGQDTSGLLLLKLAGETITARGPVGLEPGQQFWFEVKEAGDSPLLNLATQKGTIQELLREIMTTRPLLVRSGQAAAAGPEAPSSPSTPSPSLSPSGQAVSSGISATPGRGEAGAPVSGSPGQAGITPAPASSPPAAEQASPAQDAQAIVAKDGTLPPEALRLVRALVRFVAINQGTAQTGAAVSAPETPPLTSIVSTMIRDSQIPAELAAKVEDFSRVVVSPAQEIQAKDSSAQAGAAPQAKVASPYAAAQAPGQLTLAPATIKVLMALSAVSAIKVPLDNAQAPQGAAINPDQNLAEILTAIASKGKIPPALQQLTPLKILSTQLPDASLVSQSEEATGVSASGVGKDGGAISSTQAALPLQFAAAQQGGEPLPAQLRLLASLMGLGGKEQGGAAWQEIADMLNRFPADKIPAAAQKFSTFFEAHSRLNDEAVLPASSSQHTDFYLIPSLFTGQAGWGEWLWSRDRQSEDNAGGGQENLVFFLEMSNLGALTIQVVLKNKKVRGQVTMTDKEGSALVASLLPDLHSRLEALGYDLIDFSCTCQPVNIMQELKENLYGQLEAGAVSLLDVQV